jgi:hypothetical protein
MKHNLSIPLWREQGHSLFKKWTLNRNRECNLPTAEDGDVKWGVDEKTPIATW